MWGENDRRGEPTRDDVESTPVPKSGRVETPREILWREYQDLATELERATREIARLSRESATPERSAELCRLRDEESRLKAKRDELEIDLARLE